MCIVQMCILEVLRSVRSDMFSSEQSWDVPFPNSMNIARLNGALKALTPTLSSNITLRMVSRLR
jgi:hypothetical protein